MRVLLVDNHPVMLPGMRTLLQGVESVEAVHEVKDAGEALRLTGELRPDLVVLDSELGEMRGLEVCRELKSLPRPPRVVIYTAHDSNEDIAGACLAEADAYLYKGTDHEKLAEIVDRTHRGERTWILGSVERASESRLKTMVEEADLTPKEGEILPLILERHTNREIAEKLNLSSNTVKTHVHNVLKKMNLGSRQELFREASS